MTQQQIRNYYRGYNLFKSGVITVQEWQNLCNRVLNQVLYVQNIEMLRRMQFEPDRI
jgi:hypothetical protein